MKKSLFALAIAAIIGLSFTSCDPTVKTNAELLTGATNGWVLASATSEPGYELASGKIATDLINDGYLYESEVDEIITFKEDGTQIIDPGKNVDPTYGYQTPVTAAWNLSLDQSTLNMQIPFFYNDDNTSYNAQVENCRIVSLTNKEMVLAYTFTDETSTAKGTYTFTLTYKAK